MFILALGIPPPCSDATWTVGEGSATYSGMEGRDRGRLVGAGVGLAVVGLGVGGMGIGGNVGRKVGDPVVGLSDGMYVGS